MNENKHLIKNITKERKYSSEVFYVTSLCGVQTNSIDKSLIVDANGYDVTWFTPYGNTKTAGFRYKKNEVDCGECLLLALAKEAEYDYTERSKASTRFAADR